MTKIRTIYCTNYRGHDLTAAHKFSEDIKYVTEGSVNYFNFAKLYPIVAQKLENYEECDAILVTGAPVINMLVLQALHEKGIENVNLLLYHTGTESYLRRGIRTVSQGRARGDSRQTA